MRDNIYGILTVKSRLGEDLIKDATATLIRNRDRFLTAQQISTIMSRQTGISTAMSKIYSRISTSTDATLYSLVDLTKSVGGVGEVSTFSHIPIDMLQITNAYPSLMTMINIIPALKGKLVINMSQRLKADGSLANIDDFQAAVVRDQLVRSYFSSTNRTWLTPIATKFITKAYIMVLGTMLARYLNLDINSRMELSTILGYYVLSKMTTPESARNTLLGQWKYFFLPDPDDILQIFAHINDTLGKQSIDSLVDVMVVVNALGRPRLQLNVAKLSLATGYIHPDRNVSAIAIEYPPYFVWLLLLAASRQRIKITDLLKDLRLKDGLDSFAADLLGTADLYGLA